MFGWQSAPGLTAEAADKNAPTRSLLCNLREVSLRALESNQHLLDEELGELIIFKTIVIADNKYDHLPTRKKICQQSRPSNRWQVERGAIIM